MSSARGSLLCLLLLAGCAPSTKAPAPAQLTFSIAASTQDAAGDLNRKFAAEQHIELRLNPGSTSTLAQQIIQGAPADLFLSASRQWTTAVEEAGKIQHSVPYLTNSLVLIVPQANPAQVASPDDLLTDRVQHLALAGEQVPAGKYGRQALTKLEILAELTAQNKLAIGDDVRSALAYVRRGEAEAGIVYATDALVDDQVRVVHTFDPQLHDEIVYMLVLLKDAAEPEAARRYYDFLQTPPALTVFQRYGFEPYGAR